MAHFAFGQFVRRVVVFAAGGCHTLKYWLGQSWLVPYAGMFHGVMFVGGVPSKGLFAQGVFVGAFGVCCAFMPFWFERHIHRLGLLALGAD